MDSVRTLNLIETMQKTGYAAQVIVDTLRLEAERDIRARQAHDDLEEQRDLDRQARMLADAGLAAAPY